MSSIRDGGGRKGAKHDLGSKAYVNRLPLEPDRIYIAYDKRLSGFGVRISPKGSKSWIVEYRPHGGGRAVSKKRITLGPISTLTPEEARKAAREVLAQVHLNEEVKLDRAGRRATPLVHELVGRFMREEVTPTRKSGTARLYEMYFRLHIVPALGDKRGRELTHADVLRLHRAIGADKPPTANRVIMLLSGLFTWAARVGEVPNGFNPVRGTTLYREEGRERYLSTDELGRLGDALREAETVGLPWQIDENSPKAKHAPKANRRTKVSPAVTAALRLMLFTGCRAGEIRNLRWEDYDKERGLLFLPDSKTGRKTVVLPEAAIAVLDNVPRVGKYVIAGSNPKKPRYDLKKSWNAIRRHAGLAGVDGAVGVRQHDFRHSFASTGMWNNLGLPVIGKLLGHHDVATTSRYAHLAKGPHKAAADLIAEQVARGLGEPSAMGKAERMLLHGGQSVPVEGGET
jgi:integrase